MVMFRDVMPAFLALFTIFFSIGSGPALEAMTSGGSDLDYATQLCGNVVDVTANGIGAVQELNSGNRGTLSGETNSSWYKLKAGTSGNLSLTIAPQVGSDVDFAIWGPFNSTSVNNVPSTAPVRSSAASVAGVNSGLVASYYGETSPVGCGFLGLFPCNGTVNVTDETETSTGDGWLKPLEVLAGQYYILLVNNNTPNASHNITFIGVMPDCSVLPVKLTSFGGKVTAGGNQLSWQTASEQDNLGFEVQRSGRDRDFEKIGFVPAGGSPMYKQHYAFIDSRPLLGDNYYRLRQLDTDGSGDLSTDIVYLYSHLAGRDVFAYPNPTEGLSRLDVVPGRFATLDIYSIAGRKLRRQILQPNEHSVVVDLSGSATGTYLLKLVGEKETMTVRLIKQ